MAPITIHYCSGGRWSQTLDQVSGRSLARRGACEQNVREFLLEYLHQVRKRYEILSLRNSLLLSIFILFWFESSFLGCQTFST